MFCSKCGAEIAAGALFCSKCGAAVNTTENTVSADTATKEDTSQETISQEATLQENTVAKEQVGEDNSSRGVQDKVIRKKLNLALLLCIPAIIVLIIILGITSYFTLFSQSAKDSREVNKQLKLAERYLGELDYEKAVAAYKTVLSIDPNDTDTINALCLAYEEWAENDPEHAEEIYNSALTYLGRLKVKSDSESIEELMAELESKCATPTEIAETAENIPDENSLSDDGGASYGGDSVFDGNSEAISIEVRQVDNSQFPIVTVYTYVTDSQGNVIDDLRPADLNITEIKDDGTVVRGDIYDVYKILGEETINVNLVMDASGSMSGSRMIQAKNAAKSLLDAMSLTDGDRVEIISFDDYVYLNQEFTNDRTALENAVDGISDGGSTALYDALYSGVLQTYYESGAKCVIAFTDGEENASSYTFYDVVNIARNTGIPVYIIGIGDYSYDSQTLRDLAQQCSGEYYSANDSDIQTILQDIYLSIYRQQQDYYIVEYESSDDENRNSFRELVIDTADGSRYEGHSEKDYIPESDVKGAFSSDYMNMDYILDFSSQREVTDADLAGLSLAELRIARNEIFARHGRQFKDPLLNQWFYSKGWYLSIPNKYAPDYFDKNHPNPLSKLEAQNADYILAYEKNKMANEDIYPNASSVLLSGYDLALSKQVLKTALSQLDKYPYTDILEQNKALIQEAINNPDVNY